MTDWFTVANEADVPSPSLLIYSDFVRENIRRMIRIAGGVERLRPHVKTHKLPEVLRMQMEHGITKFKCATIAEAEMCAGCGAVDVLVAYQPVGPNVRRVIQLVKAFPQTKFSVISDDADAIRVLSEAAVAASPESARGSRAPVGGAPAEMPTQAPCEPRNPAQGARYSRRNLPHFEKPWAIYAIHFTTRMRRQLSPAARQIVQNSILYWKEQRYRLIASCVMEDHVHLLLQPGAKETDKQGNPVLYSLGEILHTIKSYTAHEINRHENTRGTLWEKESFDRYIRSDRDLEEKFHYICRNPWDSGLVQLNERYPWLWTADMEGWQGAQPARASQDFPASRREEHAGGVCSAKLEVFLDIDCGQHRTGVAPGPKAVELYRMIAALPGLKPGGLHAYDGHIHDSDLDARIAACEAAYAPVEVLRRRLEREGLTIPRIVAGGTPTFPIHAKRGDVECSPGTCVFWDAGYAKNLSDLDFLTAAVVLTRVVSKPSTNRLCLDLGHKAIASEMQHPRIAFLNLPDAKPVAHNEEHLVVELPNADKFKVGDCVYGIPWHICPTVALHSEAVMVEHGRATQRWKILGRDRKLTI